MRVKCKTRGCQITIKQKPASRSGPQQKCCSNCYKEKMNARAQDYYKKNSKKRVMWQVNYNKKNPEKALLIKIKCEEKTANANRNKWMKHGPNGWPDITEQKKCIEVKRGRDYIRSEQILRHEWIKKYFRIDVYIRWYSKKTSNTFIEFINWQAWKKYLQEQVKAKVKS